MIVKKINDLALDIQKTPSRYWLNIMKQNKDSNSYYVILGFDYDEEYDRYRINSVLDRLDDKRIDWYDLGCLIELAYSILKEENLSEKYKHLEQKHNLEKGE